MLLPDDQESNLEKLENERKKTSILKLLYLKSILFELSNSPVPSIPALREEEEKQKENPFRHMQ